MRILFHGYNTCCQNESGGVQNRMRTIQSLLGSREGIETELFNPYVSRIQDFDILHLFMLRYENYDLVKYAKGIGKQIVLSSIVNIKEENAIGIFCKNIVNRLPLTTIMKMKSGILQMADFIITESSKELGYLVRNYKLPENKLKTVPNGVTIRKYNGRDVFNIIGDVKKYAIVVGRFDENKNQYNLIRALKGKGIHVVFLGGPAPWDSRYHDKCIQLARDDHFFHFLGWVDHDSDLFWSALFHADTLIFPSYNETFGLVALEAGMMGCKLAISESLPILEYDSFKDCKCFSPHSIESIRDCVVDVFERNNKKELEEKISREFSWDAVINQHIEIYKKLLA